MFMKHSRQQVTATKEPWAEEAVTGGMDGPHSRICHEGVYPEPAELAQTTS